MREGGGKREKGKEGKGGGGRARAPRRETEPGRAPGPRSPMSLICIRVTSSEGGRGRAARRWGEPEGDARPPCVPSVTPLFCHSSREFWALLPHRECWKTQNTLRIPSPRRSRPAELPLEETTL